MNLLLLVLLPCEGLWIFRIDTGLHQIDLVTRAPYLRTKFFEHRESLLEAENFTRLKETRPKTRRETACRKVERSPRVCIVQAAKACSSGVVPQCLSHVDE